MISDSGEQILASQTTSNQVNSKQPSKQPNNQANNKQPNNQAKAQAKQQTTKHRKSKRSLWSILGAYCSIQGSFWSFLARPGSVLHHFWPKQKSRARTTSNSRAQHDNRARDKHTNRARARCFIPGGARGSRFGPCLRSHRSGRSGGAWFGK